MLSCLFSLYFIMKFIDIVCDCKNDALCSDVFFSAVHISSKFHILFYRSEGSLCLYTSIYSELNSVWAGYTFKIFCSFLLHGF